MFYFQVRYFFEEYPTYFNKMNIPIPKLNINRLILIKDSNKSISKLI